ncbi:hypothetical protein CJF42_25285 [Pseudoalteromonas sp. NBT06-2]|uniref:hypothetical protein n=1 Tax=Pseudoalteromonas sp. NBT06-2 TaxID=2025950 RepID=UPI000BA573D2|nr:hypothetical protein [Pseudoalteromonas sp. NBT06-2]PAJ71697.1 hypothetical protein CJF42_25285 [Pseudoalteromonas sp. NBT06-2]
MNISQQPAHSALNGEVKPMVGGGADNPDKPIRVKSQITNPTETVTISSEAAALLNKEVQPLTGGGTGLPDKPVRT